MRSNVSDRRHYDAQAGKHDSHRPVVPVGGNPGAGVRLLGNRRSGHRRDQGCDARCDRDRHQHRNQRAAGGEHRWRRPFFGPQLVAGDLHGPGGALRLPDDGAQGTDAAERRGQPADHYHGSGQRLRKRDGGRHVPVAPDDQRVGDPDHHPEADRRFAGRRKKPVVVRLAFRRGDAAGLHSRHAVRSGGQQPQSIRDRRGRSRQLHELRHRRRVRALAAIQQPVAESTARRGAGSERSPELIHHRVRPGSSRRLDRDEIRFEPAHRLRVRLRPQ